VQDRAVAASGDLDAIGRAQFALADILRRAQANALGAVGLSPSECSFRVVASGPHWRLRDYGGDGRPLLVVAAPIKRPYIWDLTPPVSAVRRCLQEHLHVYLIEWLPASEQTAGSGFDEYAQALFDCVEIISGTNGNTRPCLIGHSLGGTLATIFCASAPAAARGLVVLGAPLCFQPATSRFRDALVSLVPSAISQAGAFPGSLLSQMSALASPDTFVWSRLMDAVMSVGDAHALEIHARVERWALDEVALPGALVHQTLEWLYRDDRFLRGALPVRDKLIGPRDLSVPMLAVVHTSDEVAPPAAIKPFIDAVPVAETRIIEYAGEPGVGLQHLGVLVGRQAHAQIWPQIIGWLNGRDG
jgi:polyhydroxyalkanoate synthase subunit PhaC